MKKISFIIPIHNEESLIYKCISHLKNLPYKNYKILIGLDGCTDNSESIVKMIERKNSNIKHYVFKERRGKNSVVNDVINKTDSDIIIVHDIDWKFDWIDEETFKTFISLFDDPQIGGIAESFPITWPLREDMSTLEKGITLHGRMWIEYIKEKGIPIGDWIVLRKSQYPLLVNVFRRSLYKNNKTLGDDFERCLDIWNTDKLVVAAKDDNWPRMVSAGEKYTFSSLLKQKRRTAIARKQLHNKLCGRQLGGWPLISYTLNHLKNYRHISNTRKGFNIVSSIFLLGSLMSKLKRKKVTTTEGWHIRAR